MEEDIKSPAPQTTAIEDSTKQPQQQDEVEERKQEEPKSDKSLPTENKNSGGGGWGGGWGFSPFSVLSDLQKAAEEISRNAAAAAEKAAKSVADMQNTAEDSESSKGEEEKEESESDKENEGENDKLRRSALDKLEKASEDSVFGQSLKVLDHSVENLASGAWQALGGAWKEGSTLVQNLAESIQNGGTPRAAGTTAPSLLETGKAFTAKGMQVLEYVGKETMDLLITETGIEVEKNSRGSEQEADQDPLLEEVTFDRCFYIYGGPEQLEELEALSNHYALLFNRRKGKLPAEQKSAHDGKLKLIQQIFNLSVETDETGAELDKGKKKRDENEEINDEIKNLHDSSVSKAADLAAGFTNALAGVTVTDIIQRTAGRLESLHSEGVHRLSEMCCSAVTQLLMLGKSIIADANKVQNEDADEDTLNIEWPEDSVEKAKVIRAKAQSMSGYVEAVSNSFITGISDVAEAYAAAIKGVTADSHENIPQASVQEKANTYSELLRADQITAADKIQDGLQYLSYVVIATSMPAA